MRVTKIGFILTIMASTLSCAVPISSHDYYYTTLVVDGEMECMRAAQASRANYVAPMLPDLSNITDDYEVIDVLVDHIGTLHRELRALSATGC